MVDIYASDLAEDKKTDSFMGVGFEKAMKEAEDKGQNLVIGVFLENKNRRVE